MEATHFAETMENLNAADFQVGQMMDILHNQGRQFRVSIPFAVRPATSMALA